MRTIKGRTESLPVLSQYLSTVYYFGQKGDLSSTGRVDFEWDPAWHASAFDSGPARLRGRVNAATARLAVSSRAASDCMAALHGIRASQLRVGLTPAWVRLGVDCAFGVFWQFF